MFKKILKVIGIILGVIILAFAGLIGYLSATEFKPAPTEAVEVQPAVSQDEDGTTMVADMPTLSKDDSIKVMIWNVGYGALGDNADFFMDGGSSVMTADEARVNENMDVILQQLQTSDADIVMMQEVDRDSKRSRHIDETALIMSSMDEYCATFANNYKVAFVPFPMPPLGKVDSGLLTLSKYEVSDSTRVSLPCPFSWPVRTANLKRCLMVDRIPVVDGEPGQELVIINLHLEAYDSGEGKIAQTQAMLDVMDEELDKGNYVIAGGDFNQTFSNVDTSQYPSIGSWLPGSIDTKDFGSRWTLKMDSRVPTCRSLETPMEGLTEEQLQPDQFQYYVIDGFIVSKNVKIESFKTLDLGFINSDHNPVVMKVTLE